MSEPAFDLENPTEEHRMLRQMVRDFAREVLEPGADARDREAKLDLGLMRRLGELGLHGVTIPAEDGGAGLDTTAAVIVHHELSKVDPGFCLAYLAHAMLFVNNLYFNANAEQRARYMPKVLTGEHVGAMGMTDECRVGHYAKRLIASGLLFGDAAFHLVAFDAARPSPTH